MTPIDFFLRERRPVYIPPPPPPPPKPTAETRERATVRAAVDREISSRATQQQREQAYTLVQSYVDKVGGIGDAGITAEALPARTSQLLQESCIPTVAQAARADAEKILDVGKRDNWLPGNQKDDYGARRAAYAKAMSGGSEAYREHLTTAILEADPGALKFWLKVGDVVAMHDSGAIDDATFASLSESVAQAYNDGVIDDSAFKGLYDIDDADSQVREAEQLLAFLGASDGPETADLRRSLAQNIIDEWSSEPYPTDGYMHSYNFRRLSLAFEIAGGDPNHPEILTDLFNAQSPEVQDGILAIAGQVHSASDRVTEGDLMALLFRGAAADKRPQGDALAIRLARLPGEHPDWFSQDETERNEALATLVQSHSDAVLGALSLYDDSGARGLGENTDRQQFEVNGRDLAAVLELTAFNPNISSDHRLAAQGAVLSYARQQAQIIEASDGRVDSKGYEDASGRVLVLSAATEVAVDRGFESLQADIDAKKAAIAFVVDLALVAVPLPKRLSAKFGDEVGALFAKNPLVKEALTGLGGQAIDRATGLLTDEAKQQLYARIDNDPELTALLERQTVADAFKESLLASVPDERDRAEIRRDANGLADDISEID